MARSLRLVTTMRAMAHCLRACKTKAVGGHIRSHSRHPSMHSMLVALMPTGAQVRRTRSSMFLCGVWCVVCGVHYSHAWPLFAANFAVHDGAEAGAG
jgi:hypothetical protein